MHAAWLHLYKILEQILVIESKSFIGGRGMGGLITKKHQGSSWGDGNVRSLITVNVNQYFGCVVVTWVYIFVSSYTLCLKICAFYCIQLYVNKAHTKKSCLKQ